MEHALVTGANRGLGLEFTRQLLARGRRVVATCRQPGRAQALTGLAGMHPGHLVVLPLALPEPRAIAALAHEVEVLGLHIDLLLNNAGMLVGGERFGQLEAQALGASFAVNAQSPLLLAQALAPHLADGARVVNLSSTLGSIAATESFHSPSYAMSKAALNMATRLLAVALAHRDIVVVSMQPGWVRTDMGGADAPLSPQQAVAAMLQAIGRLDASASGRFVDADGTPQPW